MNFLDIIIAIVLIAAAVGGYRQGIIAQICGLAGVILGAWLAFRFSSRLGEWLGFELSEIAAFAILFVVSVVIVTLFGRLSGHILKWTGLGFIDKTGGLLLSVVEYSLLLGLLLGFFTRLNSKTEWVKPEVIAQSHLLPPVQKLSDTIFPYIIEAKDALLNSDAVKDAIEKTKPEKQTI